MKTLLKTHRLHYEELVAVVYHGSVSPGPISEGLRMSLNGALEVEAIAQRRPSQLVGDVHHGRNWGNNN